MNINISKDYIPILVAIISAIIVYQLNRRSKQNELFLNNITICYEKCYFPVYFSLKAILELPEDQRSKSVEQFFKTYNSPDTNIRLLANSNVLEYYLEISDNYLNYVRLKDKASEEKFWKSLKEFYTMIESECWDAHDIIYKDYKFMKSLVHKNPLLKIVMEVCVLFYNLTTFLLYISGVILYLTIWNYFFEITLIPKWWNFYLAIIFLLSSLTLHGLAMILASWYFSNKNRRENKTLKNLKHKILNWLKNYFSNEHKTSGDSSL